MTYRIVLIDSFLCCGWPCSVSPIAQIVTVDMSGQAVFEAGVLLWEMAFRRHHVDDSYPLILDTRAYDVADTCMLSVEEAEAATAAGYPVDDFVRLVRDMVAMDASTRVSLSDARRRLELILNPELVCPLTCLYCSIFVVSDRHL